MTCGRFIAYTLADLLFKETILLIILLLILPAAGVAVPGWGVISAMVILAVVSIALARVTLRTMRLKSRRFPDAGARGYVVKPLEPEGYVRIENELWPATAVGSELPTGEEIVVLRMGKGLHLLVDAVDGSVAET